MLLDPLESVKLNPSPSWQLHAESDHVPLLLHFQFVFEISLLVVPITPCFFSPSANGSKWQWKLGFRDDKSRSNSEHRALLATSGCCNWSCNYVLRFCSWCWIKLLSFSYPVSLHVWGKFVKVVAWVELLFHKTCWHQICEGNQLSLRNTTSNINHNWLLLDFYWIFGRQYWQQTHVSSAIRAFGSNHTFIDIDGITRSRTSTNFSRISLIITGVL